LKNKKAQLPFMQGVTLFTCGAGGTTYSNRNFLNNSELRFFNFGFDQYIFNKLRFTPWILNSSSF